MAEKLKPLFVIKPKTMSRRDIRRIEQSCGIVVVECAEPDEARFLEPPIGADIDAQARGALDLMRSIASSTATYYSRDSLVTWFVNALMRDPQPTKVARIASVKK